MKTNATILSTLAIDIDRQAGAWMRLIPSGSVRARDGRQFKIGGRAAMQTIVDKTRQYHGATNMLVDYDHQSIFAAKDGVGGTAKAAGWIKELEIREDGIWGRVEWTDAAASAIRAGEYRYISPVIPNRKADGQVLLILNVALTNSPALDLDAVASDALSSTLTTIGTDMNQAQNDQQEILTLLGLSAGASTDDVLAKVKAVLDRATLSASPDPDKYVPIETFQQAVAEANALRQGITKADAERHVAQHIASGHIAPFMKDWAVSLCTVNKASFDSFVAGVGPSVVRIITPQVVGRQHHSAKAANENLTETEIAVCQRMGLTAEEFAKAMPAQQEI